MINRVGKTPVGLGGRGVFGDQRADALDRPEQITNGLISHGSLRMFQRSRYSGDFFRLALLRWIFFWQRRCRSPKPADCTYLDAATVFYLIALPHKGRTS